MAKLATIHPKSNGQVFPTDEDLSHLPGVVPADEEIENTNIQIPVFYGDAGTENNFVQKNALHPLFSAGEGKEKDEAHSSKKTKKEGRKLKTFEIVGQLSSLSLDQRLFFSLLQFKFADQLDILLIIIGSIAGKIEQCLSISVDDSDLLSFVHGRGDTTDDVDLSRGDEQFN